ncbi:tyrosine-type recombinase/integrase [Szabonella alba]|uniref:Integrase arm-type DNA-binding domain-containing protein n=1 Tax=Szabonella alba TaxID=2804194 RepID=A0A8K0Y1V2_9RHOB|nr:site-specific integrase [Szabonella alba]MBL4919306.1 integrase arm-type DNA-binding domain-containing protein [Szabonella alba]
MAKALTTKAVEAAKPDRERRYELADPAFSGLYLVVQKTGAKSWALRYRFGGKSVKMTLGRWPIMGLADARAAASRAIAKIEHGVNPVEEARAEKAKKEAIDRNTVQALVTQFEKRHLRSLRSGDAVLRQFNLHVLPVWGDRDVQTITKRDVIELLDGITDSGRATTANRIRAYLSKFFNWCASRDVIDVPPTLTVKAPVKERTRERVLSDDEIRWLWRACDAGGFPWGAFGKLLLLTGQRLAEVAEMTDAEIRGDVWQLASARTKNGRAHDVPLSGAATAALAAIERVADEDGRVRFVFTTTGTSSVSGFSRGRAGLHKAMQEIAAKERGEPVEIPHWTFHDLRRTCATGLARLGIPVRVTEAVLNHVSGTGGGIVAVYQRHDYAEEKRRALDAWAAFLAELVEGKAGNVVRLRG